MICADKSTYTKTDRNGLKGEGGKYVMCQVSGVTFQVSRVMCHMSGVTGPPPANSPIAKTQIKKIYKYKKKNIKQENRKKF